MANDFSGDANCVAVYNFEESGVSADGKDYNEDSKNSNDLTDVNTVQKDADSMQGAQSIYFSNTNNEYFSIDDGDLSAGFPMKNGVGTISWSVCFWIQPLVPANTEGVLGKFAFNDGGLYIYIGTDEKLYVRVYDDAAAFDTEVYGTAFDGSTWFHVGVTYDSSDNGYRIRIWDDDGGALLGADETGTFSNACTDSSVALLIGKGSFELDGNLDEVVFFKDVLSADEIDQIRAGTYGAAGGDTLVPASGPARDMGGVGYGVGWGIMGSVGYGITAVMRNLLMNRRELFNPLNWIRKK